MSRNAQRDISQDAARIEPPIRQFDARHAAQRDEVTGLANRRRLAGHLRAEIARGGVGVLLLDIDNLNEINARFRP